MYCFSPLNKDWKRLLHLTVKPITQKSNVTVFTRKCDKRGACGHIPVCDLTKAYSVNSKRWTKFAENPYMKALGETF